MKNELFPIITLTNGVRVMNFNSPHAFEFEDGCILPAVSDDVAELTKLGNRDVENQRADSVIIDVYKKWEMSVDCWTHLMLAARYARAENVDIILAPLPVVLALKEWHETVNMSTMKTLLEKLRTIYLTDRVKKTISITKFCI